MNVRDYFTDEQQLQIENAVRAAELNTSGEICVHIEKTCKIDVLERAAYIFEKLGVHKTKLRNGVLFYLAVESKKFAILGDAGINAVVPDDFWDEIKDNAVAHFAKKEYAKGLIEGVKKAGEQLKSRFPYQDDDINELRDDISFGDNEHIDENQVL